MGWEPFNPSTKYRIGYLRAKLLEAWVSLADTDLRRDNYT